MEFVGETQHFRSSPPCKQWDDSTTFPSTGEFTGFLVTMSGCMYITYVTNVYDIVHVCTLHICKCHLYT